MKNFFRVLSVFIPMMIVMTLVGSCKEKDSIVASKTELEWTKDGGRKTVDITANCSWTVTAPEWVTVEPTSGTGTGGCCTWCFNG